MYATLINVTLDNYVYIFKFTFMRGRNYYCFGFVTSLIICTYFYGLPLISVAYFHHFLVYFLIKVCI
jgi:hypothetical protein